MNTSLSKTAVLDDLVSHLAAVGTRHASRAWRTGIAHDSQRPQTVPSGLQVLPPVSPSCSATTPALHASRQWGDRLSEWFRVSPEGVLQMAPAGDDIFLNRNGNVNAGIDASDIVLGSSSAMP